MSYTLSFRWMKFAAIAIVFWMAMSIPISILLVLIDRPQLLPLLLLAAYIPSGIWYVRRTGRDRKEFEARRS
jgi:hypothetical protein